MFYHFIFTTILIDCHVNPLEPRCQSLLTFILQRCSKPARNFSMGVTFLVKSSFLVKLPQWLFLVPLKGGIGSLFHPLAFFLPIWGLYATYHLLGEPETTIDCPP